MDKQNPAHAPGTSAGHSWLNLSWGKVSALPIAFSAALLIGATVFRPLLRFSQRTLGPHAAVYSIAAILFFAACAFVWVSVRQKRYENFKALGFFFLVAGGSFLLPIPEERIHLVKYGLLSAFLYRDLFIPKFTPKEKLTASLAAFLGSAWVGCLDEFVQLYTPQRVADPRDIVINAIGAVCGVLLIRLYRFKES